MNNSVLKARGAKCSLVRLNGCGRRRKIVKLSNAGGCTEFSVFNTDVETSVRGVLERLFFVKKGGEFVPTSWPKKAYVFGELCEFKHELIRLVGRCYQVQPQAIVAMYTGAKRTVYHNAMQSLQITPVSRRDSYLQTFVKVEKTDFTHKEDPVPRIIQPRHPRYHLELARYLKPIEHDIYLAIDHIFGYPVVAKGKNAIERGKLLSNAWSSFVDPVAIAADAKRFDQHVSEPMLSWEHSIYNNIFCDNHLKLLLSWQKENKGYLNCEDGTLQYQINGCRMSGDINTALGNVIIMCAMFQHYLRDKPKSRYVNDGDDCVLIVERRDLDHFSDLVCHFSKFGFTMELDEPVTMLEHVDFCQCRPVYFPQGYRMVRNFEPCLTKDLHTIKSIRTESDMRTQLKSIALCGISIANDCPVYGVFYRRMLEENYHAREDRSPERDGKFWLSQRMPKLSSKVSPLTRASFCLAFGISPVEQIALEEYYARVSYDYVKVTPHSLRGFD